MILILICWMYLFFTSVNLGIALAKFLKIKPADFVITSFFGLFFTTLLASAWAIFGSINGTFHITLLAINSAFYIQNKNNFKESIIDLKQGFHGFSKTLKVIFTFIFLLILAQCASAPFIIDNESYYIQTIKWLNEYGFVKGLANLHLFFGQTSGWHITQSVFNFSFLYDRFNDLNGYALLLLNFFAFQKLNDYFKNGNRTDLLFGLLSLTNVFFFPFISSPSPDLPVYILSFLSFAVYMKEESKATAFSVISILVLFAVFIKITAVILLLFPILLLINQYSKVKKKLLSIGILSFITLVLFVTKNILLTGYPLYPLAFFRCDALDYTLPTTIRDYFFGAAIMHTFYMPVGTFETASVLDLVKQYFLQSGIDSFIGLATIIIVSISPIAIRKYYADKPIWSIYSAFVLLLLLLCLSSPQYRFFVHFTIFFGLLLLSIILKNKKTIIALQGLSLVALVILLFVQLSFIRLTQNKSLSENTTFQIENSIFPKPNTKLNQEFTKAVKGNLNYNAPADYPFFWINGNGSLPCVNTEQLNYFETHFQYLPQMRSNNLKDGFYDKKVATHD